MEGLEGWEDLWNELDWHEVMGEEGLVKLIESLSEEVVEAIDRGVCAWRTTHHERLKGSWWRLIDLYNWKTKLKRDEAIKKVDIIAPLMRCLHKLLNFN